MVAGGLWNIAADIGQLENAILNLAINARDAMKGQGKLTIEAGNASLDDEYAARHEEVQPGQYVMIALTDTGCGISPEILDNVFEPFFTTKPEGQGTGLGLSMVYGFAKQSGGHVKIYSETGQGTTVRLHLPRTRQPEEIPAITDAGPLAGGTETILVVEDDEAVRRTVVDLLTDMEYKVLKAKDAEAALVVVESGVPIDLLFTDVVMPGPLRSPDLARMARERLPNIAILFTSGYTDNAIVHSGRLDPGTHLLSKPYSREALARKVRHVLANQAQTNQDRKREKRAPHHRRVSGKPLRVLVVEDEPFIRRSLVDMLIELGHEVVEAKNAADAFKSLSGAPFDILLTDVNLGGQSGIDLAIQTRELLPGIKIIISTGYGDLKGDGFLERLTGAVILAKPYAIERLAETLAEVNS